MTYLFSQRIDILESNAQKDNCGDSFNVYLESVDVAGNVLVEQWLVYVDKSPPQINLSSPNCLLDHDIVSVLLNTCRVFVSSSDESQLIKEISIRYGEIEQRSDGSPLELNLNGLETGLIHTIVIDSTDHANKVSSRSFSILIQPNLTTQMASNSCISENLSCEGSEFFGYDYLVIGSIDIDLEIQGEQDYSTLSTINGEMCFETRDLPCVYFDSLPIRFNATKEGFWYFNYSATDQLGRTYSTNEVFLVDNDELSVKSTTITPNSAELGQSSMFR